VFEKKGFNIYMIDTGWGKSTGTPK